MALKEYKAKRDFSRTNEPSGEARHSGRGKAPMFVIQKHAASHLHYDFRLEMEGVLKSWAVPKGFPTTRGDRRLAIEVEDHPLEYGRFEGTILQGNYGAGTVMLWDTGTYEVRGGEPLNALENGKLHFTLRGQKLNGQWALVRTRSMASKAQWLLLKAGSDMAPLSAKLEDSSVLTGRTLRQIERGDGNKSVGSATPSQSSTLLQPRSSQGKSRQRASSKPRTIRTPASSINKQRLPKDPKEVIRERPR